MIYNILVTKKFTKDIKKYSRKFRNIEKDINNVIEKLKNGNLIGNIIKDVNFENAVFKVRVINSDTNSGKSSGYRLLYYVLRDDGIIYLLTIYSKSDKENIRNSEIEEIIQKYCF